MAVPIYIYTNSLLCFHTNFYIICSSTVKNAIGILIGIELNLYIAMSDMVILTIFMILIQEHCISFHLFVSSSISFIGVLEFSKHRAFTSLGRFIPRFVFFFYVMVNGIVSLISLSYCIEIQQISVYYFCILQLYQIH